MKFGMRLKVLLLGEFVSQVGAAHSHESYTELYRPQYHYTPAQNWMNDFNGLVYADGTYHTYYQYNPGVNTWEAMSWGHATSRDLTHWKEQPVALLARGCPNNINEMFFSEIVVIDEHNTSGFGSKGHTPWVAMYTFFVSVVIEDLESEFGPFNAVGGVWECPNPFQLPVDGDESKMKWVSIYFVGDFNGSTFTADPNSIHDGGPSDGNFIFEDFEGNRSFAERGWVATGDLIGTSPVAGTLPGQDPVTGFLGNQLVNTFLNGDSTTGNRTCPSFKIEYKYKNFPRRRRGQYQPNRDSPEDWWYRKKQLVWLS